MALVRLWKVIGGLADALAGFTATVNEANAAARDRLGLPAAESAPTAPLALPGNGNGHADPEPAGPGQRKRRNGV